MTFQRISFGEKRGCVASGQPGAGPGMVLVLGRGGARGAVGATLGRQRKEDNHDLVVKEKIAIKIFAWSADNTFVPFLTSIKMITRSDLPRFQLCGAFIPLYLCHRFIVCTKKCKRVPSLHTFVRAHWNPFSPTGTVGHT